MSSISNGGRPAAAAWRERVSRFSMVTGAPQNALRLRWMVWNPGPSAGRLTAPAMQPPVAGPPIMCSGPGAGPVWPPAHASEIAARKNSRVRKIRIAAPGR